MATVQALLHNFTYDLALWIFNLILEIFFREIRPRGAHRIPKEGPVIFVVAPHASQVGNRSGKSERGWGVEINNRARLVCGSHYPHARMWSTRVVPHCRKVHAPKGHRTFCTYDSRQ